MEKWPIFEQHHGLTPLEQCQFFNFFNFLFFVPRNAFFRSRISKNTFSWPILSEKKKIRKMTNFWAKPWVWKNGNFSTFSTYCFYCLEGHFFVLEYHKTHFPGLYCLKKNMEKLPIFEQNHLLTALEKCQFFDFFNFLFLLSRNAFFRFRIS